MSMPCHSDLKYGRKSVGCDQLRLNARRLTAVRLAATWSSRTRTDAMCGKGTTPDVIHLTMDGPAVRRWNGGAARLWQRGMDGRPQGRRAAPHRTALPRAA